MKRLMLAVALVALAGAPAAAQWAGMPVWNSPKGGTGLTISGDFGSNNDEAGGGNAFGGRVALGLANLTLTAGMTTWDSDLSGEKTTSVGGTAAFRILGGSLLPVAVNFMFGAGRRNEGEPASEFPAFTTLVVGGGVSANLPMPGVAVEPYVSVGNRWRVGSGLLDTESNFGWTLGANANFGVFGVHVAYDSESVEGGTAGVLGLGAHLQLRAPGGF